MESSQNIVNINSRVLDGSLNTKQDWYNHLKYSLGYHLPSYKRTSMKFIKDVLASRKELLKSADVIYVNVPNYPELSVANIFKYVKYLGIYDEVKDLPDKYFFFGVLGTIKNEWLTQMVMSQQAARNTILDEEQKGESIQISEEFLREIQSVPHFSKKRGKALSMLKIKTLGRKQQKKRKCYEISNTVEFSNNNQMRQTQINMFQREDNAIMRSPPAKRMQMNQ